MDASQNYFAKYRAELAAKKSLKIQIRMDESDELLDQFPNAVEIERINNYVTYSITAAPDDDALNEPSTGDVISIVHHLEKDGPGVESMDKCNKIER